MLYIVSVRFKDESPIDFCADSHGVFSLAWILNNSDYCIEFIVTQRDMICIPKDFGYVNMEKWKTELFSNRDRIDKKIEKRDENA
jgi:hypothetical protein